MRGGCLSTPATARTSVADNMDFDGDQMSIYLSLDEAMADMWYALSPKFNIFGMDEPLKITSNVSLPKPVVATLGMWLEDEEEEDETV